MNLFIYIKNDVVVVRWAKKLFYVFIKHPHFGI